MREIEYRGKTSQGNWVYGNYVNPKNWCVFGNYHRPKDDKFGFIIEQCWVEGGRFYSNGVRWCLKETIGQYTGFKDENGNDIFEGDIVKDEFGRIMQVIYKTDRGKFQFKLIKCGEEKWTNNFIWADLTDWFADYNIVSPPKIIGNVWDNPELLEEE